MTVMGTAKPTRHLFPVPITPTGIAKSKIEGLVPIDIIGTARQR